MSGRVVAVCDDDGDPLVATFRFPGKEFVCVTCNALYGFADAPSAPATPDLVRRREQLKEQFYAERT